MHHQRKRTNEFQNEYVSKKVRLDPETYREPVSLHLKYVKIPANTQTNGCLRLNVTDGDANQPGLKPCMIYKDEPPKVQDGSEIVLFIDKIIPIQGTHFILDIVQPSTFHQDRSITKAAVLLLDILYALKQSGQEVVSYVSGWVKLEIKKEESIGKLLQQVAFSSCLKKPLDEARLAIEVLIRIGSPLHAALQKVQSVSELIRSVKYTLDEQKLSYQGLLSLMQRMASLLCAFKKVQNLQDFDNLKPAIIQLLAHMEIVLKVVLDYNNTSSQKKSIHFIIFSKQAEEFSELSFKFDNLLQEYNFALQLDIAHAQSAQTQLKETLEKLNYTDIEPGEQCLENTRVTILADIKHWAQSSEQPVLWLCGPAGTGKSTIAASVVSQLKDDSQLAAYYTCKRDNNSLTNPFQLWKNICYRLAMVYPPLGLKVAEVIKADPHFGSGAESIPALFQTLFRRPLNMLDTRPLIEPLVIVIDALDECGKVPDREKLLKCLLELPKICSWIKILITSRVNPEIEKHLLHTQQIMLKPADSYDDVETFIRVTYSEFGLSEVDINQFISAANGLFTWATTALKYMEESMDQQEAAQHLLQSQIYGSNGEYEQLHNLYNVVLSTSVGLNSINLAMFQQIMSIVLLAAEPLSLLALSKLAQCGKLVVEKMIKSLHAVIMMDLDKTVRVLHPSFAEYLLDKQNHSEQKYWISRYNGHGRMLDICFEILEKELKFNMYNISSSYLSNNEVDGLEERRSDPELEHVHYAALFWSFHMQACKVISTNQEKALVRIFNGPHTLYWIEIMGFKNKMYEALESMQTMKQIRVMQSNNPEEDCTLLREETEEILNDVSHFLSLSKEVASKSIPHIYISCLVYVPKNCQLGKSILPYFSNLLQIQDMPDMWFPHNTILKGHEDIVSSVAYSPDGRYVVSGSHNNTVRIWDTTTSQPVGQPLQGHRNNVTSVAYSPDGRYVVSGSCDMTVRIWDTITSQPVGQPLQGHNHYVTSVAYSPDGRYVVS
ncbi:hypothetical protein BDN72DRAFT_803160, partial [Pluteus cervinus]